jgi:undecaprenyl-diphosphatase
MLVFVRRHGGDKHVVATAGLPRSLARRLEPGARFGLRVTLLAVALVLVGVPFGLLLEQVKTNGPLVRLDTYAANHLHGWVVEHDWFATALRLVSDLASPVWFYVLIGGSAAFWWFRGAHHRLAAYLVTTGLLGGLVDTAVKVLVDRERPSLENPVATAHGKSFPSGHTMLATYGYGCLLLAFLPLAPARLHRPLIGTWLFVVALVAFARLGLGVHFISDVLGGFVLGLAWLAATTAAFSIWRVERGKPPVHVQEGLEPEVARH